MSDLIENLKAIESIRREPIFSQAVQLVEKLERENAALRDAIELGQANCDAEYERLRKERDANKTALAATRSQLAALRADKVRLDWLNGLAFEHKHHETGDSMGYEWTIGSEPESNPDIRAAIDAAKEELNK